MITFEDLATEIVQLTGIEQDQIKKETELRHLVIESFVLVELVIELQEAFQIRLDQSDIAKIKTVADLHHIVNLAQQRREVVHATD